MKIFCSSGEILKSKNLHITGSSGGKTNENANLVGNDGKKNYFTNKEGKVIQSAYQRIFIKHKK